MERDKLFVEFDWTSEVDDIAAGGESGGVFPEFLAECVLFMVVLLLCCGVSMVSSGGEEGNGSALHRRVVIE